MQSGYGVPEIQQFMVDSCASLLSISHDMGSSPSNQQKHNPHHHHHHHHHHHPHPQQQQQQQRFHHLSPIPITQQFFHPFHPFQQQQQHQQRRLHSQLGLDHESGPESGNSPSRIGLCQPHFVGTTNFKLGVNEENAMLRCEDGSDSRPLERWRNGEGESAIKEPFWKPLDIEYLNRNSKRCKEKHEVVSTTKYCKKSGDEGNETEEGKSSGSNYGLFSELEAIYTRSSGAGGAAGAGSGSALTGENNGPTSNTAAAGPASTAPHSCFDHGSETSTGEEAPLKNLQKRRSKRKRKHMGFFASFFQSLVKQLMDHQESLHRKFLEVMERRDQERTEREEEWRRQEAVKANREAMARVQEQALASSREAAIISFLEKMTGESIDLPSKSSGTQFRTMSSQDQERKKSDLPSTDQSIENLINSDKSNIVGNPIMDSSSSSRRWPKAEVQALIRVRSSLESRFQEPGLKAPLWEEVSSSMASLGYQRSAKRCKEKWENINKYFRKTKDTAKKRPQQSKTCPYFHQLDQLYSKAQNNDSTSVVLPKDHNSELLDAIVVASDDRPNAENPSLDHFVVQEQLQRRTDFKFPEMGPMNLDFNGGNKDGNEATELNAGQVLLQLQQDQGNEEDDNGDEEEQDADEEVDHEEEVEEEEGESQDHKGNQKEHEGKDHRLQENLFFRVES